MKKYFLTQSLFFLLTAVCFVSRVHAQNLVLNPSFEIMSTCPNGISQFELAVDWYDAAINGCTTPDLYSSCVPQVGGSNMPNAVLGYQRSRTGESHAGFIFYSEREYIEGTLATPLVAGQQYCVKFYANIGDETLFGTDDISMYFSPTLVRECPTSTLLPFVPQLNFNVMVSDTVDWVEVSALYTATGGEKYFVLGNFKSNANTTLVSIGGFNPYGYMFVDDVEITLNTCCPEVEIDTVIGTTCFGGIGGSATVSATGGTPPYTYSWSGGGGTNPTATNLSGGTHTVTVGDENGCRIVKTVIIPQAPAFSVSILSSSSGCGSVNSAVPRGGTAPYSYVWSNGNTGNNILAIAPGVYSVTASDGNNCTAMSTVTVTQPSGLNVQANVTPTTCGLCDGTVQLVPSGGTAPYSYLWSDSQSTQTATALCTGIYTVTVTDNPPAGTSIVWSEKFTNGSTGWNLNLNGSPANGPSFNRWVVNNNVADCSHCVLGTGGNYLHITCSPSEIFCSISGPTCTYFPGIPMPNPLIGDPTTDKFASSPTISTLGKAGLVLKFWYMCEGDSGKDYGLVRLSDNGGVSWTDLPKQYYGTPNCTQDSIVLPVAYENIATLKIGFRWINNNDGDGGDIPFLIDDIELSSTSTIPCVGTMPVIINSAGTLSVTVDSLADVSCAGASDGAISIAVSGGAAPYNFLWSDSSTSQNRTGLVGGNYMVTVTDAGDCSSILSVTVEEPAYLVISGTVTSANCVSGGRINMSVFGGRTAYSYLWEDSSTTEDIADLTPDNYTVTVTDSRGCTASRTFTVNTVALRLFETRKNVTCNGTNDGSAGVAVSGGIPPVSYLWNTNDTVAILNNLPGGVYSVTVTDGFNCTATRTITLNEAATLSAFASITSINCDGDSSGGIKLTPIGGTPPLTTTWAHGATGLTLIDLPPGIYSATIVDSLGCRVDTSFDLSAASVYQIDAVPTDASCGGGTDGTVTVDITSPTTPPYTYQWSTSDTTASISNLAPGTYMVTVLDDNNCPRIDTAIVTEGGLGILDSVRHTTCPAGSDGAILVTISGGTAPFNYTWSTGSNATSLQNIRAGIYTLTVTDQNDCTGSETMTVLYDSSSTAECENIVIFDVFSPNGDGVNEQWVIDGLSAFANNELQIFNRWGSLAYEASPYDNTWTGKSKKGELLPSGTYYYILKLNDPNNSIRSGHITLIR